MSERIDKLLFEQGFAKSRNQAQELIKKGLVFVDGKKIEKSSAKISSLSVIKITGTTQFVGRGGDKLAHALYYFKIKVTDVVALDIGASTGGFTDCLLQNGAKKVYAVDVGTLQLDTTLRENPKVVAMEQTDIRDATLSEKVDLVVIDVSFISLSYILPIVGNFLKKDGSIIALIKPQFEVGKGNTNDKGIVTDEKLREKVLTDITHLSKKLGFTVHEIIPSPITGSTGNVEYLIYLSA